MGSKWVFSPKQLLSMYWWADPDWSTASGIIADGSVRSGKTTAFAFGFLEWSRVTFSGMNFAFCGKTIKSFERNVLGIITQICRIYGYKVQHKRTDNLVVITFPNGSYNNYYIFGGNDEKSQDLIQGITLAGLLLDEVALMPESFVSQALARCSVPGAKIWMNCNPGAPGHFIKKEFIDKYIEKGYIYSHFTMDDNLSLTEERREFYRRQWIGVFYQRYILGRWVAAEGAIYTIYSERKSDFIIEQVPRLTRISIGFDYGASQSRCALEATGITQDRHLISLCEAHLEGIRSPEDIYAFALNFCRKVEAFFGRPQIIFCDYGALGQIITRGLQGFFRKQGYPIQISDCKKGEIIQRILLTLRLMGEGRYHITRHCPQLSAAFENALWEEDKDDVRLDDGTSDIDSLDSFEYSFYSFAENVLA